MICSTAPIIWFLSEFNVRNRRSFQSRPIGKRSRSSENSLDNPSRHHSVMKSWFCDLKGRPFFLARDNCSHRVHLPSWPKIIFLGDLVFCLWYALCDGWLLRSHYSKRLGPLWSAFFENFFSSKLPNFWKSCNFTDSFLITVSFMNTQSSSFNLANRDLHGGGEIWRAIETKWSRLAAVPSKREWILKTVFWLETKWSRKDSRDGPDQLVNSSYSIHFMIEVRR